MACVTRHAVAGGLTSHQATGDSLYSTPLGTLAIGFSIARARGFDRSCRQCSGLASLQLRSERLEPGWLPVIDVSLSFVLSLHYNLIVTTSVKRYPIREVLEYFYEYPFG